MCSDRLLAAAACLLLSCSCSVKEDRSACPCCLTIDLNCIDFENILDGQDGALRLVLHEGRDTAYMGTALVDPALAELSVKVGRGVLTRGAWVMPGEANGGHVRIAPGSECPPVWMGVSRVDCRGDEARDTIILHKRWCGVTVRMKGAGSTSWQFASAQSDVCGYAADGEVVMGNYNYVADCRGGDFSFRIPRQVDDSLSLTVGRGSPEAPSSMKVFPLGRVISGSGYDWDAADLDDVSVVLDFELSSMSVTLSGWRREEAFVVRI